MDVLWITHMGLNGPHSQTKLLQDRMPDLPGIDRFAILQGSPLQINRDETVIEGDDGELYPVESVIDAANEWGPDVVMWHVFTKPLLAFIQQIPEAAHVMRYGASFTEAVMHGSGNLNQLGPMVDVAHAVDEVVAASERTADQIESWGVDRGDITIIPTVEDFNDTTDPTEKPDRFGMLGRLEAAKNQSILVQAMSMLQDRGVDAEALLAGNPSGDKIERALQNVEPKVGLADNEIEWPGYVDPPEEYWPEVAINCHPSWTEHCPSAVLEAAKRGVPSILADLMWSQQFGELFPRADPDNPLEWADLIEFYLEEEDERIAVAERQQEHLGAHYHIDDWTPVYRDVLERAEDESDMVMTP